MLTNNEISAIRERRDRARDAGFVETPYMQPWTDISRLLAEREELKKRVADFIARHAPSGTAVIGLVSEGGDGSTITGGYGSTLVLSYWDSKSERYRCVLRYVGEDGIEAGVAYVADGIGGLKRKGGK